MEQDPIFYTVTLQKRIHEYDDVYTFVFDKPVDLLFSSGNFVHVRIPTIQLPDRWNRKLSLASSPNDGEVIFSTGTKSLSPWKKKILEMELGDSVLVYKIKGYLETPKEGKLIMIASGVGITPFRSIIREHVLEKTEITPILVHFGRENYLYENEFSGYNFPQHRITREQTEEILFPIVEQNKEAMYMVAGAPVFVESMTKTLMEKGIPENMIQTDSFDGLLE